jgi:cob(I)alamin adenosyltransferase
LYNGQILSKGSPLLDVCGEIEEALGVIGRIKLHYRQHSPFLLTIQETLLVIVRQYIGITSSSQKSSQPLVDAQQVLMTQTNALRQSPCPLVRDQDSKDSDDVTDEEAKEYILPGSSEVELIIFQCWCLIRKIERSCIRLSLSHVIDPSLIIYFNRLGDFLEALKENYLRENHMINKSINHVSSSLPQPVGTTVKNQVIMPLPINTKTGVKSMAWNTSIKSNTSSSTSSTNSSGSMTKKKRDSTSTTVEQINIGDFTKPCTIQKKN